MPAKRTSDEVSHHQLGLLPPERVHCRVDLFIVAGADVIPVTLGIYEGANDSPVSLRTTCAVRGDQEHDELLSKVAATIQEALNLVGPF